MATTSCWFLVFVWIVWWLPLMLAGHEEQRQPEGCSAKSCGNLTISDPFWLAESEAGRSCGPLDFAVDCWEDSIPILKSSAFIGFAIKGISYEERSLRVVDAHKVQDFNVSNSSCHFPGWNTSVKLARPFKVSHANCRFRLALALALSSLALISLSLRPWLEPATTRWKEEEGAHSGHGEVFPVATTPVPELVLITSVNNKHTGGRVLYPRPSAHHTAPRRTPLRALPTSLRSRPALPPRTHAIRATRSRNNKAARLKTIARALGGVGAVLFLVVACLVYFVWYKHKKRKQAIASNEFMRSGSSMTSYSKDLELDGSPHIFTFEELEVATDGFSASRELGDGGFGTVYKGKLKDGRVVAVKRLYKNNYRRVQQFLNEVDILSRLLHQNLVILYGCTSRMSRDLLLVYEFIANGTVADHLHGSRSAERGLTWPLRLNIAIETAEALAYLHAVEIIHRDVKTTNILLDNSFHVKVADFGLSRLFPLEVTHVSTVPQGTPGYVDPVYHQCYKLTDKSDVYSFGVVLVELISSKPAVDMSRSHSEINLANMALNRIQNHEVVQLVDPELGYDTDPETKRTIDCVAEVAFQCLQMDRDLRPSIKEVVEILTCVRNRDCHVKSMKKQASQKEDADFLTDGLQFSPDTVIHRFHSQSTNHSGASNASGLSNMKC
ncbi:hypothetical protein VPH35_057448 [Triticum aestivum]|uniref:non-specific serine/threonine protein kinase n=1 Tax=Triticum aestivum TaxID=4565 RepID=A0A3B6GK70_WHEAT